MPSPRELLLPALLCACTRASAPTPTPAPARDASARLAVEPAPDAAHPAAEPAPSQTVAWAPRWTCRLTGPGHAGRVEHVEVPGKPYELEPEAVHTRLTLSNGSVLWRLPVRDAAGALLPRRGRLELREAGDAGTVRESREYDVPAQAQEALFELDGRAGVAWLRPDGVRLEPLVGPESTLPGPARAVPCDEPAQQGPRARVVPIGPQPFDLPEVRGTPPLVGEARWVLSTSERNGGLCVEQLFLLGPWGRVRTAARNGALLGELGLDEAANPVRCEPRAP